VDEARGARNEASARLLPTLDLSLSHYEIVSRAFSRATQNIIERSRPLRRTDANASLQQPVFDFGANLDRLAAAEERLASARHASADSETQIALRAVGAWYNVFGYRALVSLATAFISSQRDFRTELEQRVAQGYSAPADIIQLDSYIASTSSEIADYRRRLQTAEAQFTELVGVPPPADLQRAPPPAIQYRSAEEAEADTRRMPAVLAAELLARAAHSEAKAYRADELPRLTVGADIGRYGALENARDYDARVTGTLSWRLFGGAKQRAEQARARERGAAARYERVSEEARRDASIAFTDLQGLQASEQAARQGYISARRSRDVTAQRFAVSRGTLFDLVAAENTYYSAAARYILTLTDLDTARYALLARTGALIDALGLPRRPAQ
jgi:adhesin transport system outer membrane protein